MRVFGKTRLFILFACWFGSMLPTLLQSQTWMPRPNPVNGNVRGFYEYLPSGYNDASNSSNKYPLIIFSHGLGELGNGSSDLGRLLVTGLPQLINQGRFPATVTVNGNQFSFIVICPQYVNWPGVGDIEALINYASQNYRVDPTRIYLTGLSMGGGITWDFAGSNAANANKIAAVVPICGATYPGMDKSQVIATANLPVWATHNADDGIVNVSSTIDFVSNINSFNPTPRAGNTIWSTGGHDAWTRTYDPATKLDGTRNCYEWMLQYSRSGATAPPPAGPMPLSAVITNTKNPGCNGGTDGAATVSAGGGTAPYTYSWNTTPVQTGSTASNLKAGSYVVTVRDANNNTATATAIVTEPAKVVLTVTPGTISTAGGTTNVSLSATGGWTPYTFTGPTSNVSAGTYTYEVRDVLGCRDSKTITIADGTPPPPPPPPPSSPTPLNVSIVGSTNVSCHGGSNGTASVTVVGGILPYTYSWNSNPVQTSASAVNLPAGSYTVTVRDAAGATASATVNVGQPQVLQLNAIAGTITVFGGTTQVSLNASGGTAPYQFEGTTTGLAAGQYNFGVTDAAGCKAGASVTILQPSSIVLKAQAGIIKCSGGTTNVTLSATGGVAPYVFEGNTNNLKAGTYSFSVTDANGAKGQVTITISEPAALQLSATAGNITRIGGTTNVTLNASGGTAPYNYSGNTSNLKAGTYQYKVTDANGCENTSSLEIREPGVKLNAFELNTLDTLVRLKWTTGYEYAIDRFEVEKAKDGKQFRLIRNTRSLFSSNTAVPLNYSTDDEKELLGANNYRLYAVTIYGEKLLLVERSLFFDDKGSAQIKNLTDRLEIIVKTASDEKVNIILYDVNGRPIKQIIQQKNTNLFRITVPMNDLPKGFYVARVMTTGFTTTRQVVKP